MGRSGLILSSPDGEAWSRQPSPTDRTLPALAFGDGRFVAAGESGALLTSADGLAWTAAQSGITADLAAITHAAGRFVAVGSGGSIITSADGATWSAARSGTDLALTGIAYGAGLWVAVGQNGTLLTSTALQAWSQSPAGTDVMLTGVAYGAGRFVAVGDRQEQAGVILTSNDGRHWTARESHPIRAVAFGGGQFVAAGWAKGGERVSTSADGETWRSEKLGMPVTAFALTHDGKRAYLVGSQGIVLTSPDGVAWTRRSPAGPLTDLNGVAFGVGRAIYTSSDGLRWEISHPASDRGASYIAADGDRLVALSVHGWAFTSTNGKDWESAQVAAPGHLQMAGLAGGNGLFVALATDGQESRIYTSADGAKWAERATLKAVERIAFGNGRFVAAGMDGAVYSSADGAAWRAEQSGTTDRFMALAYAGGRFVALAASGLYRSPDGVNWQMQPSPSPLYGFNRMAEGNGQVVGVGNAGSIFSAPVAP